MSTAAMPKLGGWGLEQLITEEVKKICFEVKPDIEKKTGADFKGYIPLSFRHQSVHGTNYLIKVVVGVDKCVHAMIFAALPCDGGKLTVKGVQFPKTLIDPLKPF